MSSVLKYVVVFFLKIRGGERRHIKSGTMEDNITTVQSKLEIGVNGTTAWRPKRFN